MSACALARAWCAPLTRSVWLNRLASVAALRAACRSTLGRFGVVEPSLAVDEVVSVVPPPDSSPPDSGLLVVTFAGSVPAGFRPVVPVSPRFARSLPLPSVPEVPCWYPADWAGVWVSAPV